MEAVDILKQARVLIKIGWCRKASAKDQFGRKTKYTSRDACCFDLFGALHRASGSTGEPLRQAEQLLREKIGGQELIAWNDAQSAKSKVLRLLDDTIAEVSGIPSPERAGQVREAVRGKAGPVEGVAAFRDERDAVTGKSEDIA